MSNANARNLEKVQTMIEALKMAFLDELPVRLGALENLILNMGKIWSESEYQEILRHVHSIKGNAGTMSLPEISKICHQFESYLVRVELGEKFSSIVLSNCLVYLDIMRDTAQYSQAGKEHSGLDKALMAIQSAPPGVDYKVLVVERSRLSLAIVMEVLEKYSADVDIEEDDYVAINRLLHEPYDLVISTNTATSLNGQALCAATRLSQSVNNQVPFILITSEQHTRRIPGAAPDAIISRKTNLIGELEEVVRDFFTI